MPKDIHTPGGRAKRAGARKAKLIEKLIKEGMAPEDAKKKADEVMRDNPRWDWRAG